MANINWQNLWCRFGLHVGKWGAIEFMMHYQIEAPIKELSEAKISGKYPVQYRTCENCGAVSRRKI